MPRCNPETQAFPNRTDPNLQGLTKREYAAIKALQGILAAHPGKPKEDAAKAACEYADELFRELNKK